MSLWAFGHSSALVRSISITTSQSLKAGAALFALAIFVLCDCADAQVNRCITIECPTNQVVECASPQGTVITFAPTAQTICGGTLQIVSTPPSGSVFPPGTNLVTCLATDGGGNSARCGFQVIVRDTTPPSIAAPAQVATNCATAAGARVEFSVDVSDNCDSGPQLLCTPPSGSLFPIGITPVQCVATDAAGNASTNNFVVNVSGDCPDNCLQLVCPTNVEVTLGNFLPVVWGQAFPGTYVDYNVTATNLCTGSNVLVECQPPSGSLFSVGTHTVNCTAVDGGWRKGCSFQVVVKDPKPPTIPPRRALFAPCNETLGDGTKGAHVSFAVTATDNVDKNPTVTCTPPSGSFFPLGTNQVVCVAIDDSGNAATNSFHVIVYMGLGCSLITLEEMPDNWGFELGLTAWEGEGSAFADQPVQGDVIPVKRVAEVKQQLEDKIGGDYWQDVAYPVGHQGNHWVGTAENVNNLPGGLFDNSPTDERTGALRSKSFVLEKPYINFLIGGTRDDVRLRVELLFQTDTPRPDTVMYDGLIYERLLFRTGHDQETMRWESWGVGSRKGQRGIIRIIDQSATGHLNVDDFRFEDLPPQEQRVRIGGKKYPAAVELQQNEFYHWDSPVWGFADMHTHPMSYLGFGKFVMHGEPDGDIATALRNCRCRHGGYGPDNQCGDYLRQAVMAVMDGEGPAPHYNDYNDYHPYNAIAEFNTWPVFWTITHQQMWHEWMKRTYHGGQRVIVALCVNNPLLAVGTKGFKPYDDVSVSNAQIQALKDFVGRHNDFMEIAYDPFQLRDIVRRNKLAVIIGSELDDIGNFALNNSVNEWAPSEADKTAVTNEIDRLYGLGLRYIFPVHLMNNKYGGTAIGDNMLNIANKYLNHEAFAVEPGNAGDNLNFYLADLDFTGELLKNLLPSEIVDAILGGFEKTEEKVGAGIGISAGSGLASGLFPLALLGASQLLSLVAIEAAVDGIPSEIFPFGGNYPNYFQKGETNGWDYGHKNARGLTPLGKFAVKEMMKRGMMIDIDHMSQRVVTDVLAMAEDNAVGYPLNSGHNSPRALGMVRGENGRTINQLARIRNLGGIFGVGYENSECHSFDSNWGFKQYTHSHIENDCAGTSKTFAQYYLYGIEAMHGHGVAFGTDINGLIPAPGPRFGPQSAFALGDDPDHQRRFQIVAQENGVRYPDGIERPLATPVFVGRAIDPTVEFWAPRTDLGYAYNLEQGDFFAAIRLYYWRKEQVENGSMTQSELLVDLQAAVDALHPGYPNHGRVLLYALGLLEGIHDWPVISDLNNETALLQNLGKHVYQSKVKGQTLSLAIQSDERYKRAVSVWNRYHAAYGQNVPLKPCQTGYKRWDINFEGVAHYGLIPDFLQDLHNVGMKPEDMSVLFRSAEHFAQMWTKTLDAAWWAVPRIVELKPLFNQSTGLYGLLLTFNTDGEEYDFEESDKLDPRGWRPAPTEEVWREGNLRTVRVAADSPAKFYRLRQR
jgi:microsomal dipeptidase-like Zn-dependent dipeptidase